MRFANHCILFLIYVFVVVSYLITVAGLVSHWIIFVHYLQLVIAP